MTDDLKWTGSPECQFAEREGRTLEIRKQAVSTSVGTYALIVWKDPARSAIVGVYHHPAVARFAAQTTPLDDASLARLSSNPRGNAAFPQPGFAEGAKVMNAIKETAVLPSKGTQP